MNVWYYKLAKEFQNITTISYIVSWEISPYDNIVLYTSFSYCDYSDSDTLFNLYNVCEIKNLHE